MTMTRRTGASGSLANISESNLTPILVFGPFELDEERFEVRRDGIPVAVQPRVFDTILFLVKRSNRLVTKEELIAGPWNGCFVSDSALSRAIMHARKLLSDRNGSVIRTVHKKGFRFELPVARRSANLRLTEAEGKAVSETR